MLCAALLLAAGPAGPRADITVPDVGPRTPWTSLELNNDPAHFQFAIISDLTGNERPGVFDGAVRKLNLLQPEFVMSIGDLIQGYSSDPAEIDAQWEAFERRAGKLRMPFFHVPGNHDYDGAVPAAKWNERFGKPYYHFVYRNVLFLCLNTELLIGEARDDPAADPQVAYVAEALKANAGVRWTFVFMHVPLWTSGVPNKWPAVEKLLAGRGHTVFTGHIHRYTKYVRNGQSYITLATTGGRSGLAGPAAGQFDHVVWVTVAGKGPIVANLMLGGIHDENVRTEERVAAEREARMKKMGGQ
jgi:hypothetical protein